MKLSFSKYHGAGNDFIAFDNREGLVQLTVKERSDMCHRRFGLGADGVIEIQQSHVSDFKLIYHKANGAVGSLCGNGSRCAMAFARYIGVQFADEKNISFEAHDGVYHGAVLEGKSSTGSRGEYVLNIPDVALSAVRKHKDGEYYMDNGSPHHVIFVQEDLPDVDVLSIGRNLRYNLYGKTGGCNIDFAVQEDETSMKDFSGYENGSKASRTVSTRAPGEGRKPPELRQSLRVRTYERGVEGETLSCGTGCVAVAIAEFVRRAENGTSPTDRAVSDVNTVENIFSRDLRGSNMAEGGVVSNMAEGGVVSNMAEGGVVSQVRMSGGVLTVRFQVRFQNGGKQASRHVVFANIELSGPAQHVFDGVCDVTATAP